jgi:hypothetical protein
MKIKLTLFGCAVAVAGAAAFWAYGESPAEAQAGAPTALAEMKGGTRCQFANGWASSYSYSGSVRSSISIQGMPQPVEATQAYSAKLAFELVDASTPGEWVLLGQFSELSETLRKSHGPAFESPFLVKVGAACDVRGYARLSSVSKKAAQVQQVAMHDLFVKYPTEERGEMTYENGTGLARAAFARDANGASLTRNIKSYEMAWRVKNTFQVTQSFARATLDSSWLESFQSHEGISGGLVKGAVSTLELKKEVAGTAKIAAASSRNLTDYRWENLLSGLYVDAPAETDVAAVPSAELPYVEAMKNQNIEGAFSGLLTKVDEKVNIEEQWHEMAGYLNGHPEKISEFAQAITEDEFPEQAKAVSFLVLNKTVHPQARDALLELRANPASSMGDRTRASLALVTRKDVGIEFANSLKTEALSSSSVVAEDDFLARSSLLHLGIMGSTHRDSAKVTEVARDAVKTQLNSAGQDTYLLSPALGAAGNLGDPELLSTLTGYTTHPDFNVRLLVPKAFRGYPYAQTEALFVEWLARETHPDVKEEIFDILYHQLATAQRRAGPGVVQQAIRHLKMKPMVLARQSIVHLIGPLKDTYPEAKIALMEQVPEEFRNRSGIFDQIANYLAPPELELALSRMPEFAHQYGVNQQQQAAQAVLELERNQPKVRPLEAP